MFTDSGCTVYIPEIEGNSYYSVSGNGINEFVIDPNDENKLTPNYLFKVESVLVYCM